MMRRLQISLTCLILGGIVMILCAMLWTSFKAPKFHKSGVTIEGTQVYPTRPEAVYTLNKTKLDVFLAIVTAPHRKDRRIAARQTWLSTLPNYPAIVVRFFTDGKELESSVISNLTNERDTFGDLEFMPLKGGYFLTYRILWSLFWAYEHYDFHFFLKTDDDFFCVS